jgi:hypothetical protein
MKSRKMRKQEDKTWTGKNGGCLGCRCNISVNIPDDKERRRPEKVLKQIPGKRKRKKKRKWNLPASWNRRATHSADRPADWSAASPTVLVVRAKWSFITPIGVQCRHHHETERNCIQINTNRTIPNYNQESWPYKKTKMGVEWIEETERRRKIKSKLEEKIFFRSADRKGKTKERSH